MVESEEVGALFTATSRMKCSMKRAPESLSKKSTMASMVVRRLRHSSREESSGVEGGV